MGLFDGLSHNPFSDRHEKYDNDRYWACRKKFHYLKNHVILALTGRGIGVLQEKHWMGML